VHGPISHPTRDPHLLRSPGASIDFRNSEDRTRISNAERMERDAGLGRKNAVEWYDEALKSLLNHKTDEKTRMGLQGLLADLTIGQGLGWSAIARLVGVSVPAVRKWRLGGDIKSPRLVALARLAAFLDMLKAEGINDPAAWLALPMGDEDAQPPVSKSEIYVAGGVIDLLAYAKNHISRDGLLSRITVQRYSKSQYTRVVRAPDGHLSIISDGMRGSSVDQE
jgi:transcriptional regulator with XRE-family HTH domain